MTSIWSKNIQLTKYQILLDGFSNLRILSNNLNETVTIDVFRTFYDNLHLHLHCKGVFEARDWSSIHSGSFLARNNEKSF
jgi:hypothetical protein